MSNEYKTKKSPTKKVTYSVEHGMCGNYVKETHYKEDGTVEIKENHNCTSLTEDGEPNYGPWWQ